MEDSNDMDLSSIYSKSSGTSQSSSLQLVNGKQDFGSYVSDGYIDGTEEGSDFDDENESFYVNGVHAANSGSLGNEIGSPAVAGSTLQNGTFLPVRKPRAFSISSTGSW